MHFRHISAKIQPKNLKLDYYWFLSVQRNISIGGPLAPSPHWLRPWYSKQFRNLTTFESFYYYLL